MNALKLIMMLAAEECDKSFWIIAYHLELIVGYTDGCQLLHRTAGCILRLFKSWLIMTGIIGLYGLTTSFDLPPLLLTENLGIASRLSWG